MNTGELFPDKSDIKPIIYAYEPDVTPVAYLHKVLNG